MPRNQPGSLMQTLAVVAVTVMAAACAAPPPAPTAAPAAKPAAEKPAAPAEKPTVVAEKPAPVAEKPAAPTKPLVIAISTEPATLDGQAVIDRNARVTIGNLFEGLLDRDRSAKIVPLLAESYEPINDSTWRFKLRRGVKFHNGEPFNAEAAAFSVNRIVSKDYKTLRTSYIQDIVGAKAVDEYTVDVETKGVNAVLPVQMTQLVMVPPRAAEDKDFGQRPIGTGPYKFSGWDKGREIKITASDDYWGQKPSIKDVTMRIMPDSQTQLSALQVGEIDLVLDLLPEQARLAPRTLSIPATEFSYIQFNAHKKEMSDPRVRVAMNLAVDKETLAKTVYGGHAQPNHAQHLAPGMLGYNPNVKPFPFDPARAKQLLTEAGYPNGFSLTLHAPIGRYLKGEESAEYVAAQFGEVGIKTKVELMEWTAYQEAGRIAGDQPGAFDLKYGWNSNEWFDASRIVSHITCKGTSSKLCNPKVDDLMDRAIKTLDQGARDQMYQQVWATLHDDPHSIYLLQQNLIYGVSNRLEWQPRPDDEYRVSDMKLSG
jgi:peptide/nickel transport system substrate-binding protein